MGVGKNYKVGDRLKPITGKKYPLPHVMIIGYNANGRNYKVSYLTGHYKGDEEYWERTIVDDGYIPYEETVVTRILYKYGKEI